jgi:hypothetical protein
VVTTGYGLWTNGAKDEKKGGVAAQWTTSTELLEDCGMAYAVAVSLSGELTPFTSVTIWNTANDAGKEEVVAKHVMCLFCFNGDTMPHSKCLALGKQTEGYAYRNVRLGAKKNLVAHVAVPCTKEPDAPGRLHLTAVLTDFLLLFLEGGGETRTLGRVLHQAVARGRAGAHKAR